jgi:ATP-binding cassette subfamily F protein uup
VSHDRYFLNRVCTDIMAFEGDGRIRHSVGDYDYYLEKRQRQVPPAPKVNEQAYLALNAQPKPAKSTKLRKLSFKEQRELEGMEAQIQTVDAEIARIESLFAQPDFHRTHGTETDQLVADVAAAKVKLSQLYARWEELEAIKVAAETKVG